ncbi:hypothetical protein [Shewanella sp. P1-14-1]|uniref:hypothetical protein n=1 Tax=Shewanella sp. P1-14-1 TaxID=1723761 RepID=UPI0011875882|nr:hypothetical protein [Shewanella sp. P1-14-1]
MNSSAVSVSESAIGHVIDKENDIDYENEMVRVPHKDFMDNYLDDAMELVVTTNALDHFHTVGMVSVDGNVYALEPEYESVSDFDVTFVGDESDSEFVNDTPFAPYAEIDISTMKARELIDLTRMLAIEDGDAVDNAVTITQPQVTVRKPITNSNASPSHKSAAALATAALQESGVTFDTAINVSTADMIAGALR